MTEMLVALVTLTFLEIVLGIDNVIFIAILSGKLPAAQQQRARRLGLMMALGTRILLLLSITWIVKLTTPLFGVMSHEVTGRDLVFIIGGLFLLAKSTYEIHDNLEGPGHHSEGGRAVASFGAVIVQVALLDIVFSLDSVITAVGMANDVWVMITAVILAVIVMLIAAEPISAFVERHPTLKMLALSFLLLIGISLVGEGLGQHLEKGYIYFAMGFSVFVEIINIRVRGRAKPVHLRGPHKS